MMHLRVPYLNLANALTMEDVAHGLKSVQSHPVDITPWPEFSYKPLVNVRIAYSDSSLLLQYEVSEHAAKAVYSRPNDPVYKDSCVEFFIAMDDEDHYYNFEFNCAGTCLLGYGSGRNDRILAGPALISSIRAASSIIPAAGPSFAIGWRLTVDIPFALFSHHHIAGLKGMKARGNFYKCGDDLPQPHFVTWNSVSAPQPDFHVSGSFGSITFE